jgi:hypothetical protein
MTEFGCFADSIILCKLLCYLQNNFSKETCNGLTAAFSGFFITDELVKAKAQLFDLARKLFTSDNGNDGRDLVGLPHQTT